MPQINIGLDLEDVKVKRCENINTWRDQKSCMPVVVDGATYDADAMSQTRIASMATAIANGAAPDTIMWRDHDNVTRELSQQQFMTMATAVFDQVQSAYRRSFELKDRVQALDNVQDVRAIDWDS